MFVALSTLNSRKQSVLALPPPATSWAELGRTAPAYHREVGDAAAELGVDEVLAVGELARGYLERGAPGRSVPNVHEALRVLPDVVRPGDAVLVKASRALGLEAVADALTGVAAQ